MNYDSIASLPVRIRVSELVSSRYGRGGDPADARPVSWDNRLAGVDVVKTETGLTLKLFSDGQQSPPQVGWVLLLGSGDSEQGYGWTLYGIPAQASTVETTAPGPVE